MLKLAETLALKLDPVFDVSPAGFPVFEINPTQYAFSLLLLHALLIRF